ncbi:MAG TPA: hypothetical protein VGD37_06275 [Kofleriaceae bacterium]
MARAAAPVHAQSADAEALFSDASRLMAEGKIAEACEAFASSNRIESRAGTLIRLGECRELNHQLASAWSAYKDALTRVRDPRKREVARAKVAALEPRLSYLTVLVSDEARVDGLALSRNGYPLDPGLWNRAVPTDGGAYVIGGRAPGHEGWNTTVTVPPEGGKISVEVPRFKEIARLIAAAEPPPPRGPSALPVIAAPPAAPVPEGSPGRFTARRKLALGAAGAGIVALGVGVVLGVQSNARRDEAFALCPDPAMPCAGAARADALASASRTRALGADLAFGVAAAAAITAGVLWLTGVPAPEPGRLGVAPALSAHHAGVAVTGSF